MSGIACPKCGQPHDGRSDSRGFATCRECAHCWQLKRNSPAPSQPPVPPTEQRPTTSKPFRKMQSWGTSDEYAPGDTVDQPRTNPLTVREPSGAHPSIPSLQAGGDRRKHGSSDEVQVPADFDSQLFERAERDAQVQRSQQETIAQPNPVPTPQTEGTTICPVCGHRFAPVGELDQQRCPQCSIAFSLRTGEPIGPGDDERDDDGDNVDDLIGATIRGCFVDRKLGEGGMGAVYHARQLSLDRSVAIKVMPAELTRNKNFIQRFEREAKSLARINHPNILHIYDFGEDHEHGIYFMIIEFVDGKDLGEILRGRDTIDQGEALDIVRQALLALETASQKGVIHRDIKPDNLMIAKDGTCKVSDFGLAKGYGDFTEVTTAGVRVGTPAFMSPEQCDGGEVDARSDIYSLGCTTYLALTGHLPFNGDSPFSIMLKHKTEPPPSLRKHRADIDARVDALIQRMLAKRPADRCEEMRDLIEQVQDLQVALARGGEAPRKVSTERPRSLDDSGAARLLPDAPPPASPSPPPARPITDLPLALRDDDDEPGGLPKVDFGAPSPRPATSPVPAVPSGAAVPPAIPSLQLEPVAQPPVAAPADPERSSNARARASARSVRGSSDSNPRPPVSASSSALLHVQRGDEALSTGRPSEAIREYGEAQQRKPSREVGGKLADARKQQRHRDANDLEAHGDELVRAGRYDEAIDDYMRASQQYSQVARREDLLRKVAAAQRSKSRRRLARVFFILVILVAAVGVGAYFGTPPLHDRYVEYRRVEANGLGSPAERRAALEVLATEQPFAWYARFFTRTYALPALDAVRADLQSLRGPDGELPTAETTEQREARLIQPLIEASTDVEVPWTKVVELGENLLRGLSLDSSRTQVQGIIGAARERLDGIAAALASIEAKRAEGRHDEALALAAAFPTEHPRAGGVPLPVAGTLDIRATGDLAGLVVKVDDVVLLGKDPRRFCRDPVRETRIEVSAAGHLSERLVVPPGTGEAPVVVTLQPGLRWQVNLEPKRPWWRLQRIGDDVLILGDNGIVSVDIATGTVRQVFRRSDINVPPSLPNPRWNLADLGPTGGILATSDGLVLRVGLSEGRLVYQELLRKGSSAVLGWIERELSFQPGRRTQVLIELSARGSSVSTLDGATTIWSQSGLALQTAKPWLSSVGDRVLVVDDAGLRTFEEDGTLAGGYALDGQRTGPVLAMDDGKLLVIPTLNGVTLLAVGGMPHFVRPLEDPPLERGGAQAVACDQTGLVTVDTLGVIRIFELKDGKLGALWQGNLPSGRKPNGQVALAGSTVAVVDHQNSIHLYDRSTGTLTRTYDHPALIAAAPLPVEDQLLVVDTNGVLTSYQLVR